MLKPAVFAGDYERLLSRIKRGSVDLAIVDPPFQIWEKINQAKIYDVLKPNSYLICFCTGKWEDIVSHKFEEPFFHKKTTLHWSWQNARGHIPGKERDMTRDIKIYYRGEKEVQELIPGYGKEKKHLLRGNMQYPKNNQGKGMARWWKPKEVFWELLHAYSKPGDIVLDLFSGGGNCLEVCKETKRRYIGSENSPTMLYHLNKKKPKILKASNTDCIKYLGKLLRCSAKKIHKEMKTYA